MNYFSFIFFFLLMSPLYFRYCSFVFAFLFANFISFPRPDFQLPILFGFVYTCSALLFQGCEVVHVQQPRLTNSRVQVGPEADPPESITCSDS